MCFHGSHFLFIWLYLWKQFSSWYHSTSQWYIVFSSASQRFLQTLLSPFICIFLNLHFIAYCCLCTGYVIMTQFKIVGYHFLVLINNICTIQKNQEALLRSPFACHCLEWKKRVCENDIKAKLIQLGFQVIKKRAALSERKWFLECT